MKIGVDIKGLDSVKKAFDEQAKQARYAASRALNSTAFAVNAEIKKEMQSTFKGGATPYSLRAFKVEKATKQSLAATVSLRQDFPSKGRAWDKSLGHIFTGGSRAWKRMEAAFMNAGILPRGMMMVPPENESWAMPLDSYGNPPRGLIVQLISYFHAFKSDGFRANMTKKRKDKLANRGRSENGYATINGVVYFVSHGKRNHPGNAYFIHGRHDQHLHPGIWAKRGTHGADVSPVFLFVRRGQWRRRIDLEAIGKRTVSSVFASEFDKEFANAMRTAR